MLIWRYFIHSWGRLRLHCSLWNRLVGLHAYSLVIVGCRYIILCWQRHLHHYIHTHTYSSSSTPCTVNCAFIPHSDPAKLTMGMGYNSVSRASQSTLMLQENVWCSQMMQNEQNEMLQLMRERENEKKPRRWCAIVFDSGVRARWCNAWYCSCLLTV